MTDESNHDLLGSLLASRAGVAAFVPDILGASALEVLASRATPPARRTSWRCTPSSISPPARQGATICELRDLPRSLSDSRVATNPVCPLLDAMEHKTIAAFNVLSHEGAYPCLRGRSLRSIGGCLRWLDEKSDSLVLSSDGRACHGPRGERAMRMARLSACDFCVIGCLCHLSNQARAMHDARCTFEPGQLETPARAHGFRQPISFSARLAACQLHGYNLATERRAHGCDAWTRHAGNQTRL
ncbi:hypothetical protein HU200_047498 [Digitaria exilis]|uniref:Uncharacterized protein n=1 Tax=Digitaria exilis TaxID=1010633 RepID=A0A835AXG9_9POAL|nr:hypothetical protein HU200_047498 [Digitaria exilis]